MLLELMERDEEYGISSFFSSDEQITSEISFKQQIWQ